MTSTRTASRRTRNTRNARVFSRTELAAMTDLELKDAVRDLRQLEWIASQTRRGFGRINASLEDAYREQARRARAAR